ncbi:MAG: DUF3822 family protein [Agriterribacter sp.]
MNAAYQIQRPEHEMIDSSQCNLYVELAPEYLLFGVLDTVKNEFAELNYYHLDKYNTFHHLKEILYGNVLLGNAYRETRVVYHLPECLLIPEEKYDSALNNDELNLVFGDLQKGDVLTDDPGFDGIRVIYRVPANLHSAVQARFPNASFSHTYAAFLSCRKANGPLPEGDVAFLAFYEHKLFTAFFRNGQPQLMRTFEYETAEDVTYHLLNTCQQLEADCEKTIFRISGLLDDHSSVYTELQKYFLHTELENRPGKFSYNSAFDEYPAHFFTPLFSIASCGS